MPIGILINGIHALGGRALQRGREDPYHQAAASQPVMGWESYIWRTSIAGIPCAIATTWPQPEKKTGKRKVGLSGTLPFGLFSLQQATATLSDTEALIALLSQKLPLRRRAYEIWHPAESQPARMGAEEEKVLTEELQYSLGRAELGPADFCFLASVRGKLMVIEKGGYLAFLVHNGAVRASLTPAPQARQAQEPATRVHTQAITEEEVRELVKSGAPLMLVMVSPGLVNALPAAEIISLFLKLPPQEACQKLLHKANPADLTDPAVLTWQITQAIPASEPA